jgi:hypothetical protein
MNTVRWVDPGSVPGRYFALAMILVWALGLVALILGVTRRHKSRFEPRRPIILGTAGVAYFGVCQFVSPVIPTMIVAGSLAGMMLYAAQHFNHDRTAKSPAFRGPLSRIIMATGGLLVLAHAVRVVGMMTLGRLGLL